MSYYGVRKVKVYQNKENGLFNVSCDFYDSSVRNLDGTRYWQHADKWYNDDTKENIEYKLFIDTLDGNMHGTGGKYSCLAWGNNTVELSEEEQERLKELDMLRWDNPEKAELQRLRDTEYKELSFKEWYDKVENTPCLKELADKSKDYQTRYTELRYKLYYKAWQDYLQEKKKAGKTIVKVFYGSFGTDLYVKGLGSRTLKFTSSRDYAKVFNKPKQTLINEISKFDVSDIRVIDATITDKEVIL